MATGTHCVIGAGYSGMGVARALRDRGIDVHVLERNADVGGNWLNGVYDSTYIISSRDTTGYLEYPMPKSWPDFPHRTQVLSYLRDYADRFEVRPLVQFRTEVLRVEPASPDGMGGWLMTVRRPDGAVERRHYAGVVICNGHHWDKRVPERPGTFTGRQLHSKDYHRPGDVDGERVLVVGAGNSGCDIVVEAAQHFGRALISMRRGYYFIPKTVLGMPVAEMDRPWLPVWAQRRFLTLVLRLVNGPNSRYGIPRPDHRLFDRHPIVNSQLMYALRHGTVEYRPDVARFDGRTVHFVDGSSDEVDTIVWATGFNVSFPFLDHGLFEWQEGIPKRVFGMLAPGVAGLYVFGLLQPRGGAGPLISRGAGLLARLAGLQARVGHPLAADLARLRPPEARYLVGVSETMRQIALAHKVLTVYERRRARTLRRPDDPPLTGAPTPHEGVA